MKKLLHISSNVDHALQALKAHAQDTIAETLWPTRCVICDQPGMLVCDTCRQHLPVIDQWKACPVCGAPLGRVQCCECNDVRLNAFGFSRLPVEGIRSTYAFTDAVGSIVRVWKDGGEQRLGSWMAAMMVPHVEPSWLKCTPTVTSIPATKAALARRGFDHGYALAREVALRLDLPCMHLLLQPHAQDQRELGRQGRVSNIQGAFAPVPHCMMPEAVIIVDDVCTTGSTLYGAARALKASGVRFVYGITFARVS